MCQKSKRTRNKVRFHPLETSSSGSSLLCQSCKEPKNAIFVIDPCRCCLCKECVLSGEQQGLWICASCLARSPRVSGTAFSAQKAQDLQEKYGAVSVQGNIALEKLEKFIHELTQKTK